jgi:peptide-methionine (S)-S-oxide reductase
MFPQKISSQYKIHPDFNPVFGLIEQKPLKYSKINMNNKAITTCLLIIAFLTAGCDKMADKTEKKKNYDLENAQTAIFAAGCFWGVEEAFRTLDGVIDTQVGYTGGHTENPTYKQVCSGTTGHAEAVKITYDPNTITYEKLLEVFWNKHNPTTKNRQGPDVGAQYRSAIFYHNDHQKKLAQESKEKLQNSGKYKDPVVTEIVPAQKFYPAEDYHQQYLHKRNLKYCR